MNQNGEVCRNIHLSILLISRYAPLPTATSEGRKIFLDIFCKSKSRKKRKFIAV